MDIATNTFSAVLPSFAIFVRWKKFEKFARAFRFLSFFKKSLHKYKLDPRSSFFYHEGMLEGTFRNFGLVLSCYLLNSWSKRLNTIHEYFLLEPINSELEGTGTTVISIPLTPYFSKWNKTFSKCTETVRNQRSWLIKSVSNERKMFANTYNAPDWIINDTMLLN